MLVKANLDLQEAPVQKCDRFKFEITTPRRLVGFFFFYLDGKTKGKNRSDIFFSHFDNLLIWKEKGEKCNGKVERKSSCKTRDVKNFLIESRAKKIFEMVGDGGKVSITFV